MSGSFLRVKYRTTAIQPELNRPVTSGAGALATTVIEAKGEEGDDHDPSTEETVGHEPVLFYYKYTQNIRSENVVFSDETLHRETTKPTIFEKIGMKMREDELARQNQLKIERIEKAKAKIIGELKEVTKDTKKLARLTPEEEIKQISSKRVEAISSAQEDDIIDITDPQLFGEGDRALKEEIMIVLEKKFTLQRNSAKAHPSPSFLGRLRKGFSISLGNVKSGFSSSAILPWMAISDGTYPRNLEDLIRGGYTHVLNTTTFSEVPNYFPNLFVYHRTALPTPGAEDNLKIMMSDKELLKSGAHFIERVENARGKLLVHCDTGNSRSVAIIIAYMMIAKGVCLADAYNYARAMRPTAYMPPTLLLRLALLELELSVTDALSRVQHSSILHHPDFQFAELWIIQSKKPNSKIPRGLFFTTMLMNKAKKSVLAKS